MLVLDLRTRMRGARAYVILAIYLSIIAVVLACVYYGMRNAPWRPASASPGRAKEISQAFYKGLFVTQAGIVLLFVPAFTAGAITIEHERRTFDMLVVTRLSPSAIVWGRLASSTSFTLLLLLTSLPLVSVCFLLGGVSPHEVLSSYIALAFCAFIVGAMGILSSTLVTRTVPATVLTFTFVFVYLVGTAIAGAPSSIPPAATVTPFVCLNPFMAIFYGSDPAGFFAFSASVPAWLTGGAIGILGSLLLITMAVDRLSTHFRERDPWRSRLLLALLLLLTAFLAMGWVWAIMPPTGGPLGTSGPALQLYGSAAAYVGVLMAGIGALCPMMCSGDGLGGVGRAARGRLRDALNPLRILRPGPLNSALYLVLVMVAAVPLMLLGFGLGGMSVSSPDWARVSALLAIGAVTTLCCIGLTWALSALFGKRPAAAGTAYGLILILLAVPPWASAMWATARMSRSQAIDYPWITNLIYLNPFVALYDVAMPDTIGKAFQGNLLFEGVMPFYGVTLVALGAMTIVFMLLALVATGVRQARAWARQTRVPPPGTVPGPPYGR